MLKIVFAFFFVIYACNFRCSSTTLTTIKSVIIDENEMFHNENECAYEQRDMINVYEIEMERSFSQ